ncbi:hypothetical protein FACS189443_6970 [Planctomycetales bacterium]|nr:hypothetical protein FACS189443_6970 [Planctomycetales bacterium]
MVHFEILEQELETINKERFYHPDPIVMKRCETIVCGPKVSGHNKFSELTGQHPNTIRNH